MSTEVELDAIEAEVTAWLDANWRPDRPKQEWLELVVDAGYAVPTWPRSGSGGSSTATRLAVIGRRVRRASAPRAPARTSHNLWANTVLAFGTREPEAAVHPAAAARRGGDVPALLRARRRLRPRRAADPGRARRRRVGRQRPEGVDLGRPRRPTTGCSSPAPTGTCPSTRASRSSGSRCTSPASRSGRSARSPTRPTSTRCSSPTRGCRPRTARRPQRRLAGAADGAGLRALGDGRHGPRAAARRQRGDGRRPPRAGRRPDVDLAALAQEHGRNGDPPCARRSPRCTTAAPGERAGTAAGQGRSWRRARRRRSCRSASWPCRASSTGAPRCRADIIGAEAMLDGPDHPAGRRRQLPRAQRLLHLDRRRHRPDPAQHHRRARARAAQGAGGGPRRAVPATSPRPPYSADQPRRWGRGYPVTPPA